jgi:adenylate kinase family enzyme
VKRVLVIGSGGAGKSTFALELGRSTGLPIIHLDRLHWRPGWVEPPKDEWESVVRELVKGDRWIMDGHYGGTLEIRFAAADTVIFLDLPPLVCIWSVVRRRFSSARRGRPDMAEGLGDKLELSFLLWIWNFPLTRRPRIVQLMASLPATTKAVRLTSRRAMREFLAAVPAADVPAAA